MCALPCCAALLLAHTLVPLCLPACLQEVVSPDKPRFSISGWYHRDVPQEGSAHASLQQLQMKAGEDNIQAHDDFEGEGGVGGLRRQGCGQPKSCCCFCWQQLWFD